MSPSTTNTEDLTALPDLSIDSINDLAATFLAIHAVNRSLLGVPAISMLHALTRLTKQSTNEPTLDIGSINIPNHLPKGLSVQSDEKDILCERYKYHKFQQLYEHDLGYITSWIISKSIANDEENYARENFYE